MTEIVKFRFDRRFDVDPDEVARQAAEAAAAAEVPPPPPTFDEAELEAAKAAAFEDGRRAALAEAEKASERRAAMALGVVGERLAEIERSAAEQRAVSVEDTVRLSRAIADKVAAAALSAAPTAEIEAMAEECLSRLYGDIRVVARVAEGLEQALEPRLAAIAARAGFGGTLEVRGEPGIEPGDCVIDWAQGGAVREAAAIWDEIDGIMERFVAASSAAARSTAGAGDDARPGPSQE